MVDVGATASLLELIWCVWLIALLPIKARNITDAWTDWRTLKRQAEEHRMTDPALSTAPGQSGVSEEESVEGSLTIAQGAFSMDCSIAVILVSFLLVGLASIITPPPVSQPMQGLAQYAGFLFLVANAGLTAAIVFQYGMRQRWRQDHPDIARGHSGVLVRPPPPVTPEQARPARTSAEETRVIAVAVEKEHQQERADDRSERDVVQQETHAVAREARAQGALLAKALAENTALTRQLGEDQAERAEQAAAAGEERTRIAEDTQERVQQIVPRIVTAQTPEEGDPPHSPLTVGEQIEQTHSLAEQALGTAQEAQEEAQGAREEAQEAPVEPPREAKQQEGQEAERKPGEGPPP